MMRDINVSWATLCSEHKADAITTLLLPKAEQSFQEFLITLTYRHVRTYKVNNELTQEMTMHKKCKLEYFYYIHLFGYIASKYVNIYD